MTKERFLTLTDAMVSIIATIMVLDLPRPAAINLQSLSSLALPFFAYFLSFFMIWNVWYIIIACLKKCARLIQGFIDTRVFGFL